ncbi:CorA metal ion transporter [Lobosporangium transversale]|uniref:Cora-domain-containing protein n=1 Tax=Lobosporangium transversale TaxID=64571 RepID=A0A1Y2GX17_9FUNG|nr:hypothetical protein BCR41DRAFT_350199 [Lobosporangium transversale]KAF9919245.1 CorA metal ion transporter [Lobosporangium transversale]ORZ21897.1 hypothetical protein BCR41DRAFT_350199 [Lobosporangium transversale]|eukprot:XP_021883148.1 hypothetical protein BCR41DRAFT_350199 [Lobosporangium transversale]
MSSTRNSGDHTDCSSIEQTNSFDSPGRTHINCSTDQGTSQNQQQPSRPQPFIQQREPFLSTFSQPHSPSPSSAGYSPTLRSERLLFGQQQQSTAKPYMSNITVQSEFPHYSGNYRGGIEEHQHSHHFRHHHHHHEHEHDPSGIDVMVIDYEGLDACVNEASMTDNEIQELGNGRNDTVLSGKAEEPFGRDIARAFSTGSVSTKSKDGSILRKRSARMASYYGERAPRPPIQEQQRYTFFSRTTGIIQAPSLSKILAQTSLQEGSVEAPRVFSDLLKDGCFWIDILDPTDFDMLVVSKHFHVHPLTIEDISTEEIREKYEVFKNYYFVCFRTFDQDYNSGSYLQPASMYSVVLRDGIITFHFRPTQHHLNVLRRLEQFHSHITLTPDWINYALLDDITDSFASPIQTIEYEVDSIDELVLLLRENETSDMLRRIGSCRKNVMTISRLLTNKADVIRGLMKRFDERYTIAAGGAWSNAGAGAAAAAGSSAGMPTVISSGPREAVRDPIIGGTTAEQGPTASTGLQQDRSIQTGASATSSSNTAQQQMQQQQVLQPYRDGEILLYLGDVLDHVLTMLQSLYSYEKILARSHSNYLAQISLEINQLSNKTNNVVGTLTFFASLIVPMTFVAGLWGMNVHVPGEPGAEDEPLHWWWALCGFMGLYCIVAICFGKRYGLI